MRDITIKITAGLNGKTSEIIADDNSTIKELKAAYAIRYKIEVANIEGVIDEHNFKFALGTRILDNDTRLKELLKDAVLVGELTLSAIKINAQYTACFREIDSLHPTLSQIEKLVEIEAILIKEIGIEDGTPILASSVKDIVLAAVQKDGFALQFASEDLKNDREIVLAAVQQNGLALAYASPDIQAESAIVLKAFKQNGFALQYASKDLKDNREFILAAVKKNGFAFVCTSPKLKADRNFVLAALQQNGLALRYASQDFKADREIVLAAVQQNVLAFMVAPKVFKADREFILAAVKQNGLALRYASPKLQDDRDIVLAAVQQNGLALEFASEELKKDIEIALAAVQQNGAALKCAPEELKAEIVKMSNFKHLTKTSITIVKKETQASTSSNSSNIENKKTPVPNR
jgi:hypothetical protein